jgi:hypothetical protein
VTAVERYQEQLAPDILNERSLNALREQAKAFSNTDLVPKALKGKPDDVLLVMMTAREIGMRSLAAVGGALFPIDGKIGMLAQTMIGLVEQAGHEIWPVEEGDDFCVVAGQRRGSKRVSQVRFTLDHARRMGLLDMWVEKWAKNGDKWKLEEKLVVGDVIDGANEQLVADAPDWVRKQINSGRLKYRDSWRKSPADMLWARAVARLCRRRFPDALLGLHPYTPDELGMDDGIEVEAEVLDERHPPAPDDDGPDPDDIVDVEVLEDEEVVEDGHDGEQVRAAAPPPAATPPSTTGDREGGDPAADAPAPDRAPTSAGGGDSEDGHGKPAASEATTGDSYKHSPYAGAIHAAARDAGLSDEALDEILHDVTGDVSANAVTRENWRDVLDRITSAGTA